MSLPNQSQNFSDKSDKNKPKKQTNKIAIFAVSIILLSSVGFATFLLISSSTKPNNTSKADQSSSQSSEASSSQSSQEVAPPEGLISNQDLEAKQQQAVDFNLKGIDFNAEGVTTQPLTAESLKVLKADFGDDAQSIAVDPGKKVKLTISYSSIGDDNFQKGSLYIKLSQGLKIVPDSMSDIFAGKASMKVENTVYNETDNLIIYGPGSGDKGFNQIKVGEAGTFSMTVEVDSTFEVLGVASYIKEDGGKVGKPSVFFIEPKK
jgi:hypothetical protein